MRTERNHRLTDTDWVVAKATETGVGISTEWKTYRQALRDITKTASPKMRTDMSNMIDVKSVTWPTKPS